MRRAGLAVAAAFSLCAGLSSAADLAPGSAAIARAARAGAAQAAAREGYPLRSHVLYEVRDARAADPADGAVDAIVVATPLERTRHAAYIAAYSGRNITPAQAYDGAGLPPGRLAIIVFAHGADEADEDFATRFSPATLTFSGEAPLTAEPVASETSEAVYPLASQHRARQVATVTYRFDLAGLRDAGRRTGRLSLRDATGKTFDVALDLKRFE